MPIAEHLVQELEYEGASTRKLLERIPKDKLGWKPHQKSMSLGELASHIAESLGWATEAIEQDVFNMDVENYRPFKGKDLGEILSVFDENLKKALGKISGTSDERMMGTWTMKGGGKTILSMPRAAIVRTFIISHTIHHRGQLDVYLRLNDVPLPQIYGPTADEPEMAMQG